MYIHAGVHRKRDYNFLYTVDDVTHVRTYITYMYIP